MWLLETLGRVISLPILIITFNGVVNVIADCIQSAGVFEMNSERDERLTLRPE